MKYRSGGSTPPKPTAADRAADAKFRKSIKNLKPTPEQAAAIGRANRSSGYAKGGKVKKMAVGGMPAGASATMTARPTTTTTARPTTTAAPAVSSSGPITRENLAARKAANTAAKVARGNITGTAAAASAPKLGPITRENLAARKAANTAAKIARGNTTGMAKGGKATKFGKALVKKSADTMGRAMVKKAGGGKCYASGGLVAGHKSADGIAKKGKTKTSMAKMARGGAAKMRGRDSYGGANFKKGGSC